MEQLSDTAEHLREQLDSLLKQAHRNQETMRRFNEQELELIGITSLPEFIVHLLEQLPTAFDLDSISLLLVDADEELDSLLDQNERPLLSRPNLLIRRDTADVQHLYQRHWLPRLSAYQPEHHQGLFPDSTTPQSVAMLPLVRCGELIGSLHFGSNSAARFNSDSATDFLQRLSAIAAVCLENCLNHARLKQMGLTDQLTSTNNRRYFELRLPEACAASVRHRRPLACIFIDVDHFKRVNDNWGHPEGDRVLRTIAQLVTGQLRHCDVLCRYGGEEFVVLLPDTSRDEARMVAERIRLNVSETAFQLPVPVTISAGVSLVEDFDGTPLQTLAQQLVSAADTALYRAKSNGRNRVELAE